MRVRERGKIDGPTANMTGLVLRNAFSYHFTFTYKEYPACSGRLAFFRRTHNNQLMKDRDFHIPDDESIVIAVDGEDLSETDKRNLGLEGPGFRIPSKYFAQALRVGGASAEALADWAELSPRVWIQTKESARLVANFEPVAKANGNLLASFKNGNTFAANAEFLNMGPLSFLNPAAIGALGGIVSALATQQQLIAISHQLGQVNSRIRQIEVALQSNRDRVIIETAKQIEDGMSYREKFGVLPPEKWISLSSRLNNIRDRRGEIYDEISQLSEELKSSNALKLKCEELAHLDDRLKHLLPLVASAFHSLLCLRIFELDQVLEGFTVANMDPKEVRDRHDFLLEQIYTEWQGDLSELVHVLGTVRKSAEGAQGSVSDLGVVFAPKDLRQSFNSSLSSIFKQINESICLLEAQCEDLRSPALLSRGKSVQAIAQKLVSSEIFRASVSMGVTAISTSIMSGRSRH